MITNKQYKEDMYYVLALFRATQFTDEFSPRNVDDKYKELLGRINAIPDEEPDELRANIRHVKHPIEWIKPEHPSDNLPELPHDLGNILHIPGEDD